MEWGTYHFCQKPYVGWHQFALQIIARAHEKGLLEPLVPVDPILSSAFSTPVKRPKNSCLDISKIERVFDINSGCWDADVDEVLDFLYKQTRDFNRASSFIR